MTVESETVNMIEKICGFGCGVPPPVIDCDEQARIIVTDGRIVRMFNHTSFQAALTLSPQRKWLPHERISIIFKDNNGRVHHKFVKRRKVLGFADGRIYPIDSFFGE